jgi:hypothetical protein
VRVQVKLAGRKVFKTHAEPVLLRLPPRKVGPCVVKALAVKVAVKGGVGVLDEDTGGASGVSALGREGVATAGCFGLDSLWVGEATDVEKDGWTLSEIMHAGR